MQFPPSHLTSLLFSGESLRVLSEAIIQMRSLVELRVPNIADDDLLEAVAEGCPHIAVLDVSGSKMVFNHLLQAL